MSAAIVGYKDHYRSGLRPWLAEALATSIAATIGPTSTCRVVLVPVPSAPAADRSRGTRPVYDLARAAATRSGAPLDVRSWLRSIRGRRDQAGLSHSARAVNLTGSIVAVDGIPARCQVLLVDDVVTTGATLAECARALRRVGIEPIGAATIAATARRTDSRTMA